MLQETIQLENLRQQIEDVNDEEGSQADYLDRGRPNPAQQKKAQEIIARLQKEEQRLKAQLREKLALVRKEKPEAMAEWIKVHKKILERIAAEEENGATSVRKSMAQETLTQWDKVLTGEQDYVNINWYFLKDYRNEVRKAFKSWWQFW